MTEENLFDMGGQRHLKPKPESLTMVEIVDFLKNNPGVSEKVLGRVLSDDESLNLPEFINEFSMAKYKAVLAEMGFESGIKHSDRENRPGIY